MRKISKSQTHIGNHQKLTKIQYFGINPKFVLWNVLRKLHTKFGSILINRSWWNHLHHVPHTCKISKSQINFQICQKLTKIKYFGINPKIIQGNDVRKLLTKYGLIPTNGRWYNHLRQVTNMRKISKSQISFQKYRKSRKIQDLGINQ